MEVEKLGPFATTPNILIMNGYDQEMVPDDIMPSLNSEKLNWDGVQVSQSTPEEYLRSVHATATERRTVGGTLYSGRYISVFPGILSSRMYLKTENDARQRQLEKVAEPLAAVATFHAAMPSPGPVERGAVKPAILIQTGGADPMVPPAKVKAFAKELKDAGANVDVVVYPQAKHSFTVPGADKEGMEGLKYDPDAARKSWARMIEFLKKALKT